MWHHIVYIQIIRKHKQDDSEGDVKHLEDGEKVFRVKTKDFRVGRKGN